MADASGLAGAVGNNLTYVHDSEAEQKEEQKNVKIRWLK